MTTEAPLTAPEVLAGLDALMEGRTNAPEAMRITRRPMSNNNAKVIDFDAWRAERQAREGEDTRPPIMFRIGGKEYPLPPEPPASIVLDVVRLKEALGVDAEVSVESLTAIGDALFGRDNFREILQVNRIPATELGDLVIQAFNAWPDQLVATEDAVPNRKTRRGRKPSA